MILVTGAGGFVGRAVCAHLRRDAVPCMGIDLESSAGVEACDVADPDAVGRLLRERPVCRVIHLAAMLPTACRADPFAAARVNIGGGVNLIRTAAGTGVRRFVFGSSVSVYGEVGDGSPVTEDAPACPADVYGAAKRFVEILGEAIPGFAALRIATVVGPGARRTASLWRSGIFRKAEPGKPRRIALPFAETAVLSMLHVEDAARMLVLLATVDGLPHSVYNSPAENWPAAELKRVVESLDPNLTVELDPLSRRTTPPVSGGRFIRDFGWQPPSLAARLAEALRQTC